MHSADFWGSGKDSMRLTHALPTSQCLPASVITRKTPARRRPQSLQGFSWFSRGHVCLLFTSVDMIPWEIPLEGACALDHGSVGQHHFGQCPGPHPSRLGTVALFAWSQASFTCTCLGFSSTRPQLTHQFLSVFLPWHLGITEEVS